MKHASAGRLVAAAVVATVGASTLGACLIPVEQRVKHVFVITLENKNYSDTFGTSTQDPYLTGTLKPMGALLTHYYGTGHVSLDNYISMISGQSSTLQTESDCASYNDFNLTGVTADGQAIGDGCVYPDRIKTLPDQLKTAGYSWRGYMEDMGNDPARESATCGHVALNAKDVTQTPEAPSSSVPAGDQYAGRHDPFIYFHSIIDSPDCDTNVVNLSQLDADLASVKTTPNFVFITPNLCDDGHDGDGTGRSRQGLRRRAAGRTDHERRLPEDLGAQDPGLARLSARRTSHHQLRREQHRVHRGERRPDDRRADDHRDLQRRLLLQRTARARTSRARRRRRSWCPRRRRTTS